MRVALVTDGVFPYVIGGMQKHSFYLAKYLAQNQIQVDLFHFNESEKDISLLELFSNEEKKYIESIEFEFPKLDCFPGHYIRESYRYSEMVFQKLESSLDKYDFIYTKGFTGWKLLEEKKKGMKTCPIGVNFHGYEMFQKPPNFKTWLEHLILRNPVKKIANSADVVFSYGGKITPIIESLGVDKRNIIELPTGIDSLWINKNNNEVHKPLRFVFIGRFERRKGLNELNEVLRQIVNSCKFSFTFVGPIPKDKQIKHTNILYLGAVNDAEIIKKTLSESDVLVCPSHSEGMPNVIMEGMASGLAVIAADVGAISNQVDVNNGMLIQSGSIKSLKEAMEKMINISSKQLTLMKFNSVEKVENNFLWDKIVIDLINHIKRINEEA